MAEDGSSPGPSSREPQLPEPPSTSSTPPPDPDTIAQHGNSKGEGAGPSKSSNKRTSDARASADSSISTKYRRYLSHLNADPNSETRASTPSDDEPMPDVGPEEVSEPERPQNDVPFPPPLPFMLSPEDAESESDHSDHSEDWRNFQEAASLGMYDLSDDEESVASLADSQDGYQEPECILYEMPAAKSLDGRMPIPTRFLVKWSGVSYLRSSWERENEWVFLNLTHRVRMAWEQEKLDRASGKSKGFDLEVFEATCQREEELRRMRRTVRRFRRWLIRAKEMVELQAEDNGATLPLRPHRHLTAREWELPREEREKLMRKLAGEVGDEGEEVSIDPKDPKGKGKAPESPST